MNVADKKKIRIILNISSVTLAMFDTAIILNLWGKLEEQH